LGSVSELYSFSFGFRKIFWRSTGFALSKAVGWFLNYNLGVDAESVRRFGNPNMGYTRAPSAVERQIPKKRQIGDLQFFQPYAYTKEQMNIGVGEWVFRKILVPNQALQ
jgi:hypothetical protein